MLSFEITTELTKKLKEISDLTSKKRSFLETLDREAKEAIHRYARISTIGATTRIENAVLTDTEIDWMDETLSKDGHPTAFNEHKEMIENKLSKDKERSIEEVAGCRNMLGLIYTQAKELFPLTETTIRGLHKELLQFYPAASHYLGRYKIASNSVVQKIGSKITRVVFQTADAGPMTSAAMHDLAEWYNEILPHHPWSLAVVCEFVFRFLAIHPFQDGNGRVGRGLFTLSLFQSPDANLSYVIPYLALDRSIERNREEYYLVLRQCSGGKFSQEPKKYKIQYFLEFILKRMKETLEHDIDFYAKKHEAFLNLAPAPRAVLECFREYPEKKLMTQDILSETKIPRRTVVHAVNQLLKEGFLQKYGQGAGVHYQLTF